MGRALVGGEERPVLGGPGRPRLPRPCGGGVRRGVGEGDGKGCKPIQRSCGECCNRRIPAGIVGVLHHEESQSGNHHRRFPGIVALDRCLVPGRVQVRRHLALVHAHLCAADFAGRAAAAVAPDLRSDLLSVEEEVALVVAPWDERRQVRAGDAPRIDDRAGERDICRRLSHVSAVVPLVGAEDIELFVDEDLLPGGGGVLVDHGEGEPGRRDGADALPCEECRVAAVGFEEVGHVVGEQAVDVIGVSLEVRLVVVPVHVGHPDAVEVDRDVIGSQIGVVPAVGHVEPGVADRRIRREWQVSRRPGHGVVQPAPGTGHVLAVAEGVDDVAVEVVSPHRGDVATALPVAFALVAVVEHIPGRADSDVVVFIALGDGVFRVEDGGVGHRAALEVADGGVSDRHDDVLVTREGCDGSTDADRDRFGDVARIQGDRDVRGFCGPVVFNIDPYYVRLPGKDRIARVRDRSVGDG